MKYYSEEVVKKIITDAMEYGMEISQSVPMSADGYPSFKMPDKYGRLIDADLCLEKFKLYCKGCKKEIDCYSCWVSDTFDVLESMPTILEARE